MALEVYSETTAKNNMFARILLVGPPKAGKTVAALTAPKPFLINCDSRGAAKGAINLGAKFIGVDVSTRAEWREACQLAASCVKEGRAESIIVDTYTLLCDSLLDDIVREGKLAGFDQWKEQANNTIGGLRFLMALDGQNGSPGAHLIVTAHMDVDKDSIAGILPSIGGMTKKRAPALIDDWVLLDVDTSGPEPRRQFLLGPQKSWNASGRNVRRVCQVPANMPALFKELGLGGF